MLLFRGAPDQADACIERDLPRAMRRVAERSGHDDADACRNESARF
jgi:hypothetical protein